MAKDLLRPCPVCGSVSGTVLHSQELVVLDELHAPDAFDVVACATCGLVFADTPTEQAVLDEAYEKHSKYADTTLYGDGDESTAAAPPEAPWDVDRLRSTAAQLAEIVPDRQARILDAGCATGTLLGFLKSLGYENLTGLEPSPVATATARRVHGVHAITGSFITPPDDVGPFDLVALTHVMEHLSELHSAVDSMYLLTAHGGLVYLEVPDAVHYVDHLVAPFHDFNTEHINHFSPDTLHRLMAARGFKRVDFGGKAVMCAPDYTYPAIYGVWMRPDTDNEPASALPPYDTTLVSATKKYVEQSQVLMSAIDAKLRSDLRDISRVIVWGAGQLAMKLLHDTMLADLDVVAVIDSSPQKHGMHVKGTPVQPPSAVVDHDLPIVVTSVHHEESIIRTIREQFGFTNPLITLARPAHWTS